MGSGIQEKEIMKCVVCRKADTQAGTATVTLERGQLTLVVKGAPAQVCPNCGEQYVDEKVASELLATAEELLKSGAQVEVRQYVKAS
jgi:YgiT-type zinc finger domain-containing protein